MAHQQQSKRTRGRRKLIGTAAKAMKRRCTCGKVYAASRAEAERQFSLACMRAGKPDKVRFYECSFGSWHWTRRLRGYPAKPAAVRGPADRLNPEQRAPTDDELTADARRSHAAPATSLRNDEGTPTSSPSASGTTSARPSTNRTVAPTARSTETYSLNLHPCAGICHGSTPGGIGLDFGSCSDPTIASASLRASPLIVAEFSRRIG